MQTPKSPLQRLLRQGLIPLSIAASLTLGITLFSGNTFIFKLFNDWFNQVHYHYGAESDPNAAPLTPSPNPLHTFELEVFVDPEIIVSPEIIFSPEFDPDLGDFNVGFNAPVAPNIHNLPNININNRNEVELQPPLQNQSFDSESRFSFAAAITSHQSTLPSAASPSTQLFSFSEVLRIPSFPAPLDNQLTPSQEAIPNSLVEESSKTATVTGQIAQTPELTIGIAERAKPSDLLGEAAKKSAEIATEESYNELMHPFVSHHAMEDLLSMPTIITDDQEAKPIR